MILKNRLLFILLLCIPVILVYSQDFYWENPEILSRNNPRFPIVEVDDTRAVLMWYEFTQVNEEITRGYVSFGYTLDGRKWFFEERAIGPVEFSGEPVPFASILFDGGLSVAYTTGSNKIHIVQKSFPDVASDNEPDFGVFENTASITTSSPSVVPRLYQSSANEMLLFVTQQTQNSGDILGRGGLGISYSISSDGRFWTDFQPLVNQSQLTMNYLPSHAILGNQDYVVFQVFTPGRNASNQLYIVSSSDGGRSWSPPALISTFQDDELLSPSGVYDNQRPSLFSSEGSLHLAWERKAAGATNPSVYYGILNAEGQFIENTPERVSRLSVSNRNPEIFRLDGQIYILWFDNRAGEDHIILGWKEGINWRDWDLTRMQGESVFGEALILSDNLYLLWENRRQADTFLYILKPDTTVPVPSLRGLNFTGGRPAKQDLYSLRWSIGSDSSGIAGFSYNWTRGYKEAPPMGRNPMVLNDTRSREIELFSDGEWYFNIAAQDYAGNWSATASIAMVRDTTPPDPPVISVPETDENGYLPSNTFQIDWRPADENDVAGYSYSMEYIAGADYRGEITRASIPKPRGVINTIAPSMSFKNRDNGLWVVSVSSIDEVGNVSEPSYIAFRMNKYIPVTYITSIDAVADIAGQLDISLIGRGFSVGGKVHTAILDKDGVEPWDYEYGSDRFTVVNDRNIKNWKIEDIDEGAYRIGLIHPERGLYLTNTRIELESSGTVKFGDFSYAPPSRWKKITDAIIILSFNSVASVFLIIIFAAGIVFSIFKIMRVMRESRDLEIETQQFLRGKQSRLNGTSQRISAMKKKGIGLRLKFSLWITMLITLVVLMVSVALGQYMIRAQRRNLAEGLLERSRVLLESISTGAREYLPGQVSLELGLLPNQSEAMSDAVYVTITGAGAEDPDQYNYIWGTNDQELLNSLEDGRISPGRTPLEDEIRDEVIALKEKINTEASEELSAIIEEYNRLDSELTELAGVLRQRPNDTEAREQFNRLGEELRGFNEELERRLKEISNAVMSLPSFNPEDLDLSVDEYLFYKPIVFRLPGDDLFFRGMIRLGVTTDRIREELTVAQQTLVRIAVIIAIVSAVIGVLGALILATIIIIPIRRLVQGVEHIRDTEDKEDLKQHHINTKTRDELASLADTINEMTQGLVKAAQANKELTVGKEVQKMFLPLDKDNQGKKMSTGGALTDKIELFGYYEGAKGVSGDYFDFVKLDENRYAVIMCDVAGKGVPASLIMVEVATIFLNYIKTAQAQGNKIDLTELVYSINDLVEERGFQGRFAALILGILNLKNGQFTMCNAGYKFVQLYSNAKKTMWSKTLNEAPATGVFPNFMVEMKGGFFEINETLEKKDCVILFSDGIEEAQRKFRDSNFKIVKCQEPGMKEGDLHDTHPYGNDNEEFSIPRIQEIINAVMNRREYRLVKYHNPIPDESLRFDFSTCEEKVEQAVLAMVAVEKVFRINPDPEATINDKIVVDRKINDFLKEHFIEYSTYFHSPIEGKDEDSYIQFAYLKEDEQYDDLTILGIRRL